MDGLSLPQLLVLPLSKLPEVPAGLHVLGRQDVDSLRGDGRELNLIDRVAVPLVNHREALVQDGLAFLESLGRVPLVGNQGQPEVLGEACGEVVLDDVVAIEIHAREMCLSVFKASDDEVVVVRVLIVALLVAHPRQIVGIIRNRVADIIIEQEAFMGELPQPPGSLLEVGVLASGSDEHILRDLLISVDIVVLCIKMGGYSAGHRRRAACLWQSRYPDRT